MDSSSVIMRLEAAADAAAAEARVLTWKRTAAARMRTLEAKLAAEEIELEIEATVAKARYHAMQKLEEKIRTESRVKVKTGDSGIISESKLATISEDENEGHFMHTGLCEKENTGKLCQTQKIEGNSKTSEKYGQTSCELCKIENPAQSHSAGKWPGQVSESRVLQTQSESAQEIQEMNETEMRKIEIKKREEIDIEKEENELNLGQLKIEVENRITEMKIEIQRRKKNAEIRRMKLQGEISRRKIDVGNSRRRMDVEYSGRKTEEENSRNRGNMEKAQKSRNLKEETQNRNMERTRSKQEIEENEQSWRWDSSLITEILVDEMPSLENLEEEVAEIGPQNYGHPFFDDDWSGAVTGTEEKATKNDYLYLNNSEKKNQEETKIEKEIEENEERKAENEAAESKVEQKDEEEKVRKHKEEIMKERTDGKQQENRSYAYESQYSEKRKRPPRKLIKLKSMSREERPKSTLMKRFLFNRLRPPETLRRGQGEGLCHQTSSRQI